MRLAVKDFGDEPAGLILNIRDPEKPTERVSEFVWTPECDVTQLAQQIVIRAQEEADGSGNGVHHFAVQAFRKDEAQSFDQKRFQLYSDSAPDDPTPGESTAKGLLGQTHRHLENRDKAFAAIFSTAIHGFGQIIQSQENQLAQYAATEGERLGLLKELVTGRGALNLDLMERADQLENRKFGFQILKEKVLPLALPHLMKSLLPGAEIKDGVPPAEAFDLNKLGAFLEAKDKELEEMKNSTLQLTAQVQSLSLQLQHAIGPKPKKKR